MPNASSTKNAFTSDSDSNNVDRTGTKNNYKQKFNNN